MNAELFGTDGIRGPAGVYPLDASGVQQIGKAIGTYFAKPGESVPVGWDPRESSEMLVEAVIEGLVAVGVDPHKVGVIPTPGLAYVSKRQKVPAGVMITASHNPYTDNGIKVFTGDGRKLDDNAQAGLNDLISKDIADHAAGRPSDDTSAINDYEDFLVTSAEGVSFSSLHLGVDSANGATSGIAASVFKKLNARVVPLFDKPDGKNINVQCGATDTSALRAAVLKQGLDAGVALDGDGDRVMLIDEKGRELTGDHMLYILAVTGKHKGVVATLMSNQGLETSLKERGIALHRTAVGDRSVFEGMDQTGYTLGGEQSGHIILSKYEATGDGLLAAIQTLSAVVTSGKTLASWRDELVLLPQALVNVPVADKSLLDHPDIQAFIAGQTAELGTKGRLNVRPSGTEPKVRVMVEAPDADQRARSIANQLTKLMGQQLTLIPADESMKPLITYLAVGEDAGLEAQLITKSRQPNIMQYTPKDTEKRFGSGEMLKQWRAKGREIHWLLGADNDLAGIIWYGKSEFPLDIKLPETPQETFAIRLYDGYAGHGLARPFMELSLKTAVQLKQARGEPITGIWLQTDLDNPAAIAAYTKFGYKEVARDEKRVTMVLGTAQIKEYT